VAPLTVDGLPIGGRRLFETILEARVPLTGSFGAVLFVDTGNVWEAGSNIALNDLRANVGAGIRWGSPVGIVRADLGYQLTPIEGLVLDGAPEQRHWRVHFSIGEAF
jgi:outer membrane translocation and assembly module TamA